MIEWPFRVGLVLALGGCAQSREGDELGESSSGGTSGNAPSTSSSATTTPGTTASGTTDPGTAAETDTTAVDSSSTGADALQLCGIEDLAPGAPNPLVASDRTPMQLPTEVADILTRSCGCHLADDLVIPGDYPEAGTLDLTTWPAWQSPYGTKLTYEAARERLDPAVPLLVMPPMQCDTGGGETMLPEDRARLLAWVEALAPDGVTWSQR